MKYIYVHTCIFTEISNRTHVIMYNSQYFSLVVINKQTKSPPKQQFDWFMGLWEQKLEGRVCGAQTGV